MKRRAALTICATAASSLRTLGLTVVAARTLDADQFGTFSLLLISYVLVTGGARALLVEFHLSSGQYENGISSIPHSFKITAPVAIAGLAIAFAADQPTALLLIFVPGLVVYEQARTLEIGLGNAAIGLVVDSAWTSVTLLAAGLQATGYLSLEHTVVAWAATPSVIGSLLSLWLHKSVRRSTRPSTVEKRFSWAYLADYLIGSGSSQIAMLCIPIVTSPSVTGAIRGGGTVLNPLTQVATAARPLLLATTGASLRADPQSAFRKNIKVTLTLTIALVAGAIIAAMLPDVVGQSLLGETWRSAQTVLFPLGLEIALSLIAQVAFAAHRAAVRGGRIIIIRSTLAAVRVPSILLVAAHAGQAEPVAWAMCGVAALSAATWWLSYFQINGTKVA